MNKKLLPFLLGVAVGAGASYYLTRKHYEKLWAEDVQKLENEYNDLWASAVDGIKKDDEVLANERRTPIMEDKPKMEDMLRDLGYDASGDPLPEEVFEDAEYIEEEEEVDSEWVAQPLVYPGLEGPIFEITFSEFMEENGFDKVTLHFYTEDGMFTDEKDNLLQQPHDLVPYEPFDDRYFDGRGEIYTRNLDRKMDFEVIMLEASYQQMVLGIGVDDPESLEKFRKRGNLGEHKH